MHNHAQDRSSELLESEAPGVSASSNRIPQAARLPRPRVLAVAAHPVGGIRTWMRYCYRHEGFRDYDLVVAVPDYEINHVLADDLSSYGIQVRVLGKGLGEFAANLQRTILFERWDLLHSHGFSAAGLVAAAAAVRRTPHLATVHDVLLANQFSDLRGRLRRGWIGLALQSASMVHTVSPAATENLLQNFPRLRNRQERITCVSNGIDSAAYRNARALDLHATYALQADDFVIGFFGRFMSQKGFKYLLEALLLLRKDTRLPGRPIVLAVGNGGFRSAEERQVAALGLTDNVIFEDFVSEPAPMMKGVDAVVMPSLWEASGLVAMEAMTAGVPFICSDCEALSESANGSPSIVVPRANSERLAAAIAAAMEDRAGSNSLRKAALEYADLAASRFDARKTGAGVAQLYARFCDVREFRI